MYSLIVWWEIIMYLYFGGCVYIMVLQVEKSYCCFQGIWFCCLVYRILIIDLEFVVNLKLLES